MIFKNIILFNEICFFVFFMEFFLLHFNEIFHFHFHKTALHLAIEKGDDLIVKDLLSMAQINVNIRAILIIYVF